MPVTLYNSEYVTLEYHPERGLIMHTIHKPISSQAEVFMDALNTGTEAMEKYHISKWLSDDRKNGPLSDELLDWAFNDWNPRTIKAGWKYWANVVPADLEAAGTLIPMIHEVSKRGLLMRVFTSVDKAVEWLDTLKNPAV